MEKKMAMRDTEERSPADRKRKQILVRNWWTGLEVVTHQEPYGTEDKNKSLRLRRE